MGMFVVDTLDNPTRDELYVDEMIGNLMMTTSTVLACCFEVVMFEAKRDERSIRDCADTRHVEDLRTLQS